MKWNKKAFSEAALVSMIIVLASFFAIAGVVLTVFNPDVIGTKGEENACKSSIDLRASTMIKAKIPGVTGKVSLPLLCKTQDLKFKGTKKKVMKNIADKMTKTWWMFGEGRYEEILTGTDLSVTFFGGKRTNDCFLVYTILVDDLKDGNITSEEFVDYLRTTTYPKSNTTYLNYIQFKEGPGKIVILTENIEPNSAYGISYLAKNKESVSTTVEGVSKMIGSITLGTVGVTACVIFSGGICGLGILAIGGAGVIGYSGISDIQSVYEEFRTKFYGKKERDVSIIVFDKLDSAQKHCFEGDLGGN